VPRVSAHRGELKDRRKQHVSLNQASEGQLGEERRALAIWEKGPAGRRHGHETALADATETLAERPKKTGETTAQAKKSARSEGEGGARKPDGQIACLAFADGKARLPSFQESLARFLERVADRTRDAYQEPCQNKAKAVCEGQTNCAYHGFNPSPWKAPGICCQGMGKLRGNCGLPRKRLCSQRARHRAC